MTTSPKFRLPPSQPIGLLDSKRVCQSMPPGVCDDSQVALVQQLLHKAKYPLDLKIFFASLSGRKGLKPALVEHLQEHYNEYATLTSKVAVVQTSADASTTKLAIELYDNERIETVIMRHAHSRNTICVSSQVGCAMQCSFCATGTLGIRGNLSRGEIVEQLVHATRILDQEGNASPSDPTPQHLKGRNNHKIRNVVFMGMGEPLNNYINVLEAAKCMLDRRIWSLQYHHVTISTVGVIPNMRRLSRDLPQVNLALSLHAPFQEMRLRIVPTAKHYPLEDLMDALDNHMKMSLQVNDHDPRRKQTVIHEDEKKEDTNMQDPPPQSKKMKKRAMIEYVMCKYCSLVRCNFDSKENYTIIITLLAFILFLVQGETSSFDCAHELGRLCGRRNVVVNLIPYNPTNVKDPLQCPSIDHILKFQSIVASYGCWCFVRRTMGQDIAGACGQLANLSPHDIEDGPFGSTNAKSKPAAANVKIKRKTSSLTNHNSNSSQSKQHQVPQSDAELEIVSSMPDLSHLILPLKAATAISFVCMVATTFFHLHSKSKRSK